MCMWADRIGWTLSRFVQSWPALRTMATEVHNVVVDNKESRRVSLEPAIPIGVFAVSPNARWMRCISGYSTLTHQMHSIVHNVSKQDDEERERGGGGGGDRLCWQSRWWGGGRWSLAIPNITIWAELLARRAPPSFRFLHLLCSLCQPDDKTP